MIGNAVVNRIHAHIAQAGQKRGAANRQREVLVDSGSLVDWDSVVLTALLLVRYWQASDDNTSLARLEQPQHLPSRHQRATVATSQVSPSGATMGSFLALVGWLLLFVLCWPIALLALVLWPIVWLISLPFRLLGIAFDAVFAFMRAVLFLPARVLGHRER